MKKKPNLEQSIEQDIQKRQVSVSSSADKLIENKKKVKELELEMEQLKRQLKPIAKKAPIETDDGSIVYIGSSVGSYLNKSQMVKILMEKLKLSEAVALKLVDAGSVKKVIQSYVKVLAN